MDETAAVTDDALLASLHDVATKVEVPGTPLTLRLDHALLAGDGAVLVWSYLDPESWEDDDGAGLRRVRGWTEVGLRSGDASQVTRAWWAGAQLEAAVVYKRQIDADWTPGAAPVERRWDVDTAWDALVVHLGRWHEPGVVAQDRRTGVIRVDDGGWVQEFRIDPQLWSAYLDDDAVTDDAEDIGIVPADVALSGGLPVWVVDELDDARGPGAPVISLVDGRLVGLDS